VGNVDVKAYMKPAVVDESRKLDQRKCGKRGKRDEAGQRQPAAPIFRRSVEQEKGDGEWQRYEGDIFGRCRQTDRGAKHEAARSRRALQRLDEAHQRNKQKRQRENIFLEVAGMHGHGRERGRGNSRPERRRGGQHLAGQKEGGKDRKGSGRDGKRPTELHYRLRIGKSGKGVGCPGDLKHEKRMIVVVGATL
jgi:hypothetical protein